MEFAPEPVIPGSIPNLNDASGKIWTPLYCHSCSFSPEVFGEVMLNLIRNPNINSSHLFRADVSLDCPFAGGIPDQLEIRPRITQLIGFDLKTVMVRTLIPRNILVDKPLDQTCLW